MAPGTERVWGVVLQMQVNRSTSQVDVQVLNLKLDELELASLRGDVQEMSLHVNFDSRMGRGKMSVAGPRYSGLQVPCPDLCPAVWHRSCLCGLPCCA